MPIADTPAADTPAADTLCDVVVVGGGLGGIYAVRRFHQQGLSVVGLDGADGLGGVWYHNGYPGARVDVDSVDYCYYFSPDLFGQWKWSERYASQPDLLRYLNHVADKFDVRKRFRLRSWVTSAIWQPERKRYLVTTSQQETLGCRFLVMATGNLSAPRKPDFPGLDCFRGEWVQTSRWPQGGVDYAGRKVAVIGTGSSGVQTVPVVAQSADHVYVFQRTPNYAVPARNGPLDEQAWSAIGADVPAARARLFSQPAGTSVIHGDRRASDCTPAERRAALQAQWLRGGQGFNLVFADQGVDRMANDYAADFVRERIRETVRDRAVAEALCPFDHPIGSRRLCLDTNYYQTYNQDNVTLVNVRTEAIERVTPQGIQTAARHYDVDLIVFALGFHAFTGALDSAGIRNETGAAPTDRWNRGPRTYLGLMTSGFPNLFTLTGAGSPSVLANMMLGNEQHVDFVADCIAHMDAGGLSAVEPDVAAEDAWTAHVAQVAARLLRLQVRNYMVHVNPDDNSRVFIPYTGGFDRYVKHCDDVVDRGYAGFVFT
jgi:cation diffusion facilitator CzcD-associated flavoprotein CzcO